MEKYKNNCDKECYRGVTSETLFGKLEFHEVLPQINTDRQWALHTNMGSLTVIDRMTGYSGGIRDIETGYRDTDGKFWLASGMKDVRESGVVTMQEAIDFVKKNANICVGA